MSQDPFAGLGGGGLEGGGGFDLSSMLEQAQQMQAQLVAAQEELAATEVEGAAGGVSVVLTGTGELTEVRIPPGAVGGADEESLAELGDLIVAAYRDGKVKVDELAARTLGPLAGDQGIPDAGELGPGV